MRNQELSRQIQQLKNLIKKVDEASNGNIELQAEWARYLCVLSAGLLENAIKIIYSEFAKSKVSLPIANYISSNLSPIRSPKPQKFLETAAIFKEDWRLELENYLDDNGRGDAIDSIMNHRHLVAHGKSRNSNITLTRLKDYLARCIEALEFIEEQCRR
jgi:RiboL-PSP-HEPN